MQYPGGSDDAKDRVEVEDFTGSNGAKLAATVLLIRDGDSGIEVWVQERVNSMPHYPGMTVFPGGGVDARDFPPRSWDSGELWTGSSDISVARVLGTTRYKAHALVFAAVRELFEETGTLLAVHADGRPIADASYLHKEREGLVTHRLSLTDVLRRHKLKVQADLLRPWARWVGVSEAGTRFDTHSFIAVAPEGQSPDGDTSEADDAGWLTPELLLEGWHAGLVRLAIATWDQLNQLTQYDSVADAMAASYTADLSPTAGDLTGDDRFEEYYSRHPVDRIGRRRGFIN